MITHSPIACCQNELIFPLIDNPTRSIKAAILANAAASWKADSVEGLRSLMKTANLNFAGDSIDSGFSSRFLFVARLSLFLEPSERDLLARV